MVSRPVVGVICEYDPFHRGHARHFELIRKALPGALILCVMSGCFTQRGAAALFAPGFRAEAALRAGASAVLELPSAFAVRDAEGFAMGGVELLSRLGFVTHLSFGAEGGSGDNPRGFAALHAAAELLEHPDAAFEGAIKAALETGHSLAAAKGRALAQRLPEYAEAFEQPNNMLGICYLRALARLGSGIEPLIVRREGDYHEQGLESAYPSATAVRAAYLGGDAAAASEACGYALPTSPFCPPDALDAVLLHTLRTASPPALRALPDCTEGLENRLADCARQATSREALLSALKTRRYAYSRLSRLCCHALLGVTGELLATHPAPEYARLLALDTGDRDMRALLSQSRLPIVSKAADGDRAGSLYQLDMRAYDLWALGAGLPAGLMLTQGVQVL